VSVLPFTAPGFLACFARFCRGGAGLSGGTSWRADTAGGVSEQAATSTKTAHTTAEASTRIHRMQPRSSGCVKPSFSNRRRPHGGGSLPTAESDIVLPYCLTMCLGWLRDRSSFSARSKLHRRTRFVGARRVVGSLGPGVSVRSSQTLPAALTPTLAHEPCRQPRRAAVCRRKARCPRR